MVREGFVEHVMVLDDRVHEGLVARLLTMPSVSYMTRHAGLDSLHAAAMEVATRSVRVFDPAGQDTIGGGCGEKQVLSAAIRCLLEDQKPEIVEVDLSDDLGVKGGDVCGGKILVFVEPFIS